MSDIGQAVQTATIADGTVVNFVVVGGRLLRVSRDLTTTEDVTPDSIAIDPDARVYLTPFSNRLVVNDGVNSPWVASDLLSSPVTGATISYESDGSAWVAYGPLVVWQDSLFAIVRSRNGEGASAGTPERRTSRIGWSEVDDPFTGWHQTNFDNEWDVVENGTAAINALVANNAELQYYREMSIGYLNGSLDDLRTTATHDAIDESIGTRAPATLQSFGQNIFFADADGRVMMIAGNAVSQLWLQQRRVVTAAKTRFPEITARTACGVIVPELDLYLVALWSPDPTNATLVFPTELSVFRAANGTYNGRWTIGPRNGDKLAVHAMGTLVGANDEARLCVLGKPSLADASDAVGLYLLDTLDDEQWHDDDDVPDILITTHRIGYSASTISSADRATAIVTTVPDPTPADPDEDLVESVTISPASFSLAASETRQLTAVVRNAAGDVLTGVAVTWASDNPSAISVGPTGIATGGSVGGLAHIHATADGIQSNAATVQNTTSVADNVPAAVTVAPLTAALSVGQTRQLVAVVKNADGTVLIGIPITWASSASTIVSVGSTGIASAVAAGSANLTATAGTVTSAPAVVTSTSLATHYNLTLSATHGLVGTAITVNATRVDVNGVAIAAAGVVVTWSKLGAGGSFASATSTTNASGVASVAFTLGLDASVSYVITATDASGLTGTSATITVDSGSVVDTTPSDWDGGMVEVWDHRGAGVPAPGAEPTGVLLCTFTPPMSGGFGAPDGAGFSAQVGTLEGTTYRTGTPEYVVLRNEDDTKRIVTAVTAGQITIAGGSSWVEEHIVTLSSGVVNPSTYTATVTYGARRAGTNPEAPRLVVDLDPSHMVPSGGTYAATSWSDLVSALWSDPDRTFTIPAGLAETTNVVLRKPPGHGWTVIKTTGSLPTDGTVMTDAVAAAHNYPSITQASYLLPALSGSRVAGEVPYKILFRGLDIAAPPNQLTLDIFTGALVTFAPSGNRLADQPHRIIFDKCNAHVPDTSDMGAVMQIIGRHMGGRDGRAWGGHNGDKARGFRDSKAIDFEYGTGPYHFQNYVVAATDEPIESGGTDSSYRHLVTADVVLDGVASMKPVEWITGAGLSSPKAFKSNGLYEFKTAERTKAVNCLIDHTHVELQNGYGVQNWPVNQGGGQPWARSQNHLVDGCWFRNVTSVFALFAAYDPTNNPVASYGALAYLRNAIVTGFGTTDPAYTRAIYAGSAANDASFAGPGCHGIAIDRVTIEIPITGGAMFLQTAGANYLDLVVKNSLIKLHAGALVLQSPITQPAAAALAANITFKNCAIAGETNGAAYRPNAGDASMHYVTSFDAELVGSAAALASSSTVVGDLPNLAIKNTSTYFTAADDGGSLGADTAAIATALTTLATGVGLA